VPSQKQLRWSQLRVGITVVFAAVILAFLIFLMSGTTGLFSPTMRFVSYVDNAGGLRTGAPVRLQSVDIGNVAGIRIVNHHDVNGASTPVQIIMKVNAKYHPFIHTDTRVLLSTAGVLGETYIDLDSTHAKGPVAANHAELPSEAVPDIQDVVRTSQTTLQNVSILVKRLDRIVAAVEDQKGTVGELIYDRELYNNLNSSVSQVKGMITDINNGRGSLGKLISDDALYNRVNETIDKVNLIADNVNSGKGTVGRLMSDPSLYNNANETLAKANQLMDGINRGEGALGKFARDPEFAKKVDLLVTNLSAISSDLQAGQGTAGKFLKDPVLYNNANLLLVEGRNLIAAVRQNPKQYLSIKLHIF